MNKKKGVTLIELIAAMAIMTIVLTMVNSIFSSSNKFYKSALEKTDTMDILRNALANIEKDCRYSNSTYVKEDITSYKSDLLLWDEDGLILINSLNSEKKPILYLVKNNELHKIILTDDYIRDKDIIICKDIDITMDIHSENDNLLKIKATLKNKSYETTISIKRFGG